MRSGMRSWSKWVIFSRRMKSSRSVGPRRPALSEFWLSAIGTPWLVVSTRPLESVRTRSSGRLPGFNPRRGLPVFELAFDSESVLPVAEGSSGSTVLPGLGCGREVAVLAFLVLVVRHRLGERLYGGDLGLQRVRIAAAFARRTGDGAACAGTGGRGRARRLLSCHGFPSADVRRTAQKDRMVAGQSANRQSRRKRISLCS